MLFGLFLGAWVIAPFVLYVVVIGLGYLVNHKNPLNDNFSYVLASGFAALIVIGSMTIYISQTAHLTPFVILIFSLLGFLKAKKNLKQLMTITISKLILAVVFVIAGLPVLIYKSVSWPGWVQLDDTATFLAMTTRIFQYGYTIPQNIISTYDRVLSTQLDSTLLGNYWSTVSSIKFTYPIGSMVPLGTMGKLANIDLAWVYFPYLACCISLTAVLVYDTLNKYFGSNFYLILISISTSLASTYYAYALWGGIKEVSIVPMLFFGLIAIERAFNGTRIYLSSDFFIYLLSIFAIYQIGGRTALGLVVLQFSFFALHRYWEKIREVQNSIYLATLSIIVLILLSHRYWQSFFTSFLVPTIPDSGNFSRPLNPLQILGIWPSGEFRRDLYWKPVSTFALFCVIILCLIGLIYSFREKFYIFVAGALSVTFVFLYSEKLSGIWMTGKAIAVASPFFLLLAFIGGIALKERANLRLFGNFVIIFLFFGLLTSNYLQYRYVWLAPSSKVQELAKIGTLFKTDGQALMTDFSTFGSRYFLRDLAAESAGELRVHRIPLRNGELVQKNLSADIDAFDNSVISYYKFLVLKHTAVNSRPLFNYDLVFRGKFYDVWERNDLINKAILSQGFGSLYQSGEVVNCSQISEFSKKIEGDLYTSFRSKNVTFDLSSGIIDEKFSKNGTRGGSLNIFGEGKVIGVIDIPKPAKYEIFLGGNFGGHLELLIDGATIFKGQPTLEGDNQLSNYLAEIDLIQGKHVLELIFKRPVWLPGAGVGTVVGPLYLSDQTAADSQIFRFDKASVSRICGKNLDWIAGYARK